MFDFVNQPYFSALIFGALSAISLPIGALLGLFTKPSKQFISAIMSFGAGSLIAAIAFELVNPALEEVGGGFFPLAIGLLLGCLMFIGLSRLLDNTSGSFARKRSTLLAHLKTQKKEKYKEIIAQLSKVDFLRSLPAEQVQGLLPYIEIEEFPKDSVIFDQNNYGDSMYIVEKGQVRIDWTDETGGKRNVCTMGPGETFGEMALIWNAQRTASVIAETNVSTWKIRKEDFDLLIRSSSEMKAAVIELAEHRRKTGNLPVVTITNEEWSKQAIKNMDEDNYKPTEMELKAAVSDNKSGAALSIWLGTFLDGIPESLVIGATMTGLTISPALIIGLCVANFPESMSSSTLMKQSGFKSKHIILLWSSLVVAVGIGAMLGNLFCQQLPPMAKGIFEGIAGGSMLAMAAQTMLPEAYEQNIWTVGLFTVLGFMVTIFFHSMS